jgi:2-methylcitrate dehydratase PrpD
MADCKIHPTDVLANYVANLRYEELPEEVVDYTKVLVLDFLASALAGRQVNGIFNEIVVKVVCSMGGAEQSSILFGNQKLPACNAAFINGVYGHGADIDDGHRTAQGHPGVAVIPAILALAEAENSAIEDVIAAIVAGYDVYVRLSNAVMPSLFLRGFHGTGTVGAVAAGAAAARLLNLDKDGVKRAISLAAVQASGLFEISESGQMAKPINPGNAARTGILSALLAKEGSDAPQKPLEGNKGFFKAFADEVNESAITDGLGQRFKVTECYIKLYPACRHLHGVVDAAARHYKNGVPIYQIDKILLHVYPAAINVTGNIREPRNEDEAKFSMTYAAATGLLTGNYTLRDLKMAANIRPEIKELINKMEIISVPELEDRKNNIRGAKVEIRLSDGTVFTEQVMLPKGDPEVPLEEGDLRNKLRFCAEGIYDEAHQQKIYDTVMELEKLENIEQLMHLLKK